MSTKGLNELAHDVNIDLHFNNKILAQAEGTGIDFYTINFARLACAPLSLASQGQRLYNSSLSNLPVYGSADDRLQFGWGERHLYRNLGVNLFEYEHLLLASALGEFFSEDYAAAVFSALAEGCEDEDRPRPHRSSFHALVHSANGILAMSDFPVIVDDRIRLNPYHDHDRGRPHMTETTEVIPVSEMAATLCRFGQLRSGEISEMTVAGGDVLGWCAAFAELFLDLRVSILDHDGHKLFEANAGHTQGVTLVFAPPEIHSNGDSSTIWLRQSTAAAELSKTIPAKLTGRIQQQLLIKVFGKAFHILDTDEAKTFGQALGASARVMELLTHRQTNLNEQISPENKSNAGSWGMGLIQTWMNWFPEIRHLQGRMERAWKLPDMSSAGRVCEECIDRLETLCGCYICSPQVGPDDAEFQPKHEFCISTLMETIIMLGLALSSVTLAPCLYPSRAGVLCMYRSQVHKRLQLKIPGNVAPYSKDSLPESDIKAALSEASPKTRGWILFGSDWNASYPRRLVNVLALFSGSWPKTDIKDNLVALHHEGMCAYVMKLQRGDFAPPGAEDNVIRVVTGSINWRQKSLSRVCLGPVQPPVAVEDGWDGIQCNHLKQKLYVK